MPGAEPCRHHEWVDGFLNITSSVSSTVWTPISGWILGFRPESHLTSRPAQILYQHQEVQKEAGDFAEYLKTANGHPPR